MTDETTQAEFLITLTSDIVAAHVANNSVSVGDVANLITSVHNALAGLNAPVEPVEEKPKGAVSVRASIKADHLVSMIDGKPYKMLKRHLSLNGYTPESYKKAFDLPADYPMTAASYSAQRKALAVKIGLGRKPGQGKKAAVAKAPTKKAAAKPATAE